MCKTKIYKIHLVHRNIFYTLYIIITKTQLHIWYKVENTYFTRIITI
jgi:hypothetical protein